MPQSTKDVSIEGLTAEGYKFLDGTIVEWPEEDDGTIRTRDQDGNHLETFEVGDEDYDHWKSYFNETESEKRRREYMDAGCKVCLHCKSKDISSGEIDWNDPLGVRVHCAECGKNWTDLYTMIDVIED